MKTKSLFIAAAMLVVCNAANAQCKGKCRNGKGIYTDVDNGWVYDGTFKDGLFEGKGTYTYPTGDIYTGDFKNGLPDGKGIYTFATGDRYEGDFKEGKREGRGTYTFSSGTQQIGEFEAGELVEEIKIIRKKKE